MFTATGKAVIKLTFNKTFGKSSCTMLNLFRYANLCPWNGGLGRPPNIWFDT